MYMIHIRRPVDDVRFAVPASNFTVTRPKRFMPLLTFSNLRVWKLNIYHKVGPKKIAIMIQPLLSRVVKPLFLFLKKKFYTAGAPPTPLKTILKTHFPGIHSTKNGVIEATPPSQSSTSAPPHEARTSQL